MLYHAARDALLLYEAIVPVKVSSLARAYDNLDKINCKVSATN